MDRGERFYGRQRADVADSEERMTSERAELDWQEFKAMILQHTVDTTNSDIALLLEAVRPIYVALWQPPLQEQIRPSSSEVVPPLVLELAEMLLQQRMAPLYAIIATQQHQLYQLAAARGGNRPPVT